MTMNLKMDDRQNDLSKVYGIGPECRKGMSAEVLANYYRPEVGRMHAEHVAEGKGNA
jgi:hypothetical protein